MKLLDTQVLKGPHFERLAKSVRSWTCASMRVPFCCFTHSSSLPDLLVLLAIFFPFKLCLYRLLGQGFSDVCSSLSIIFVFHEGNWVRRAGISEFYPRDLGFNPWSYFNLVIFNKCNKKVHSLLSMFSCSTENYESTFSYCMSLLLILQAHAHLLEVIILYISFSISAYKNKLISVFNWFYPPLQC